MKKLLLIIFIAFTLPASSQSWAAPGATWHYDFVLYAIPFPHYGYERIQNIGDTVINSRQYNKLQIYRTWYDQSLQTSVGYYESRLEFTRADSGVVYFYRDSADYVLYDFNAQPGETWVLRNEFEGTPCDTASVVVDSISTVIINGDTLRTLRTSPVSWPGITFQYPRIIEKIGSLANLLPYTMCVTDIPQGYDLRCYSDSSGWTYQNPNWTSTCDDMMSVDESIERNPFTVIPDMQSHMLTLSGAPIRMGAVIQIYNSSGQLLLEKISDSENVLQVNFAVSSGGIYFVMVVGEESWATEKFFMNGE